MTRPEVVGPRNQSKHIARLLDQRVGKELLRRNDRRKNFEAGEATGLCLAIGAVGLLAAWQGSIVSFDLEIWQRISMTVLGVVLLVVQYGMRRNFYNNTEAPLIGARKRKQHVDNSGSEREAGGDGRDREVGG